MAISVVGAGPGGVLAALLLAKRGYDVEVFEMKDKVGGRTTQIEEGDYRFDTGPTFYMGPFVLDEALKSVGIDINAHVDFRRIDPMYRLHYGDGSSYRAGNRPEEIKEELNKLHPGDGEGYERFMKTNRARFQNCYLRLLKRDFHGLKGKLSPDFLKLALYRVDRPLYYELSRFFSDPRSILAFTFQAKYIGMSPHTAPSFFTLLSFIEYEYGIWHPMGGFWKLMEVMRGLAEKEGAKFYTKSNVEELIVEEGKVKGLRVNGESISADRVIINADLPYSMKNLIGTEHRKKYTDQWLENAGYSCSTVMFYWGINRKMKELEHHNIFLAKDYAKNLEDIYKNHRVTSDSSFYAWNPSLMDPYYAPEGHSILYILFPTTNLEKEVDWEDAVHNLRETALLRLEEHGLSNIRDEIQAEKVITPKNWSENYNVYRGATFNLAHSLNQIGPFRPPNRDRDISGLYWVGGGTHPGSGLPTIFKGAENTVNRLVKDTKGTVKSTVSHSTDMGAEV